jgi:hypothetical protein
MAKCRDCDGKGYEYSPVGGMAGNSITCTGCGGSGEVSQSPEHMVSQPNLHQEPVYSFGAIMPDWMEGKSVEELEGIALLRACADQLLLVEEESCDELADEVDRYLKKIGV